LTGFSLEGPGWAWAALEAGWAGEESRLQEAFTGALCRETSKCFTALQLYGPK